MPSYVFPGYPTFIERAATELGRPETAQPASRMAALTALANLCSQAVHAEPTDALGILAKGAEFRDQLQTALKAADLMLAEVQAECSRPVEVREVDPVAVEVPRATRVGTIRATRGAL